MLVVGCASRDVYRRLIIELREQCDTPPHPVVLGFLAGHLDGQHEVRGVPSGRQGSLSNAGLVHRASIGPGVVDLQLLRWLEVHGRHDIVEHLWPRLRHHMSVLVPPGAIEEEAVDVHAIVGGGSLSR